MENRHCGYVTLMGAPNVGKSTLLNQLVGGKVSIVSPKVQTTRFIINGIALHENTQIIFVDTPGVFRPKNKRPLEQAIVKQAYLGFEDAHQLAILIDAKRGFCEDTNGLISRLKKSEKRAIAIINKIDAVPKESLLALASQLSEESCFSDIFMVSALKGDGVADVLSYCAKQMPKGHWLYPEDVMSDLPIRMLAAEITREKVFHHVHKELPYQLTVETESFKEEKKIVTLHQTIYVTRDSHKGILLGKQGAMMKKIGQQSRLELQTILGKKVMLKLFVKVRSGWMDKKELLIPTDRH